MLSHLVHVVFLSSWHVVIDDEPCLAAYVTATHVGRLPGLS